MIKNIFIGSCVFLLTATVSMAAGKGKGESGDEKLVSGMSIVGNNEAPKSLVIIPWKSSEIGQESKLNSNLLDDGLNPVDKAVFERELNFYKLGNSN